MREFQTFFSWNLWLPSKNSFVLGDVRLRLLWIVLRQFSKNDFTLSSSEPQYVLNKSQNSNLIGIPNINRIMIIGKQQGCDAFYQIIYKAVRTRWRTITKMVRSSPLRAWLIKACDTRPSFKRMRLTIPIKNPNSTSIHVIESVICHGDGFLTVLGFIINRTRSDGTPLAIIIFALRTNQWITLNFWRGRNNNARIFSRANPSKLCVPIDPSFNVWIGIFK